MAGSNRRPTYYNPSESEFFEQTPKHVLYAALRDFAALRPQFNCFEDALDSGAWIAEVKDRIRILREQQIIEQ